MKALTLDGEGDLGGEGLSEHDVGGLAAVHGVVVLGRRQEHEGVLGPGPWGPRVENNSVLVPI